MSTTVKPPYDIFLDTTGKPLDNGRIYIGEVNANPETNPVEVFYDRAMTIPAPNPVSTIAGYPARAGAAASIYTSGGYSITVKDKNSVTVFTSLNNSDDAVDGQTVPIKNYFANSTFETGTTVGWSLGKDTGTTTPTSGGFGGGLSGFLPLSINGSTPLAGQNSLTLSKPSGNIQGSTLYTDNMTVELEDVGAEMYIGFSYTTPSSGYTSGDIKVFLWDVAGGALVTLSGTSLPGSSGAPAKFSASCTLPANKTTFRVILMFTSSSNTAALDFEFDSFAFSPYTFADAATTGYVDAATDAPAILAKLLTVDSDTSGLNATTVKGLSPGQSGTNYLVYADASGNVLVGTTTSNGNARMQVALAVSKTDTTPRVVTFLGSNDALPAGLTIAIQGGASQGVRQVILQTEDFGSGAGGTLALNPSGGTVLVGTTTSSAGNGKLQLAGQSSLVNLVNDAATITARTTNDATQIGYLQFSNAGPTHLVVDVAQALGFGTSGAERMRITSGGNVLVNRTTDDGSGAEFQVKGKASFGTTLDISNTTGSGIRAYAGATSGTTYCVIESIRNGGLGNILAFNPSLGYVTIARTSNDGSNANLQVNGSASNTTGVWINVSDERVKTDIKPITGALDKVVALAEAMAHFKYKDESGIEAGYRTGPIAQRLEKAGFEGHVITSTEDVMDEKIGAILGWEYGDQEYEEEEKYTEEESYIEEESFIDEKTGEESAREIEKTKTVEKTRMVTKTRRVVTKKGEALKSVENNFTPYLFPAFKELLEYTRSLEKRLTAIEK